ncbi:MAG TPA: alkaline phosphatase family protein, partial [Minicystis sp.]|nr:alkaline phosphatase family protein [Minicystis sp.]
MPALRRLAAAALAAALSLGCSSKPADPPRGNGKRMIVLGIDGMDPGVASELMKAGRMPNLSKLAAQGTFGKLATSSPPESPVAWSDFITSMHSDGHGIFDFVHRDPEKLQPYLSTSRAKTPTVVKLGSLALPIGGGGVELLRGGRAFWSYLDDADVPATVLMIPAAYPPLHEGRARVIAGMGTPDLLGTYGVFQLYTTDPDWKDRTVAGGRIEMMQVKRGEVVPLELHGPPNPFSSEGAPLKMPFELVVDAERPSALLRIGDEERVLQPGEWTDWLPVSFSPPLSPSVHGMVRAFLKSLSPEI